ncbi:MAG: YbhB/YbcL family Raf kinase inhibitor-like protein [Desulfobacterales bacterium]
MKLTSSVFQNEGNIPAKYTCDGDNINPPLSISDIPAEAKSLVLLMDDPDVPKKLRKDGMWDHWVVFNMPTDIDHIAEGSEPPGTPGKGTNGETGYFGPCPPDREHRYFFRLYALDVRLKLPEGSDKAAVENAMKEHIIEKDTLMGRYERQ